MSIDAPLEKPGWRLTFQDEFDRPQLNDMYWFPAYRPGRKEYVKRIGKESRWREVVWLACSAQNGPVG